ncbi:hypothetical protein F5Y18DRAFT_439531 [Xylariaceae sp. FL1019]|nr:hypothetical protein F5Y18DRAFT_439531 [Xylariaceae sp. FL1019]
MGSALRAAILGCNENTIQCLMAHPQQVDHTQLEFLYTLIAAASRGRHDIVVRLTPTNGCLSPIIPTLVAAMMRAAIDHGMIGTVEYFIESWYKHQLPQNRPIQSDVVRHAFRRGRNNIAWTMLNYQGQCEAWNRNEVKGMLHDAAYAGHDELTRFLLDGPWIQSRKERPVIALLSAVEGGQARLVEYLFQCEPVLEIFQNRPEGLLSMDHELIQFYGLQYWISVGEVALIKAAEIKNPRLIGLLQSKKANITRFFEIAYPNSRRWSQPWLLDIIRSLTEAESDEPNFVLNLWWDLWCENHGEPEVHIRLQPRKDGVYLTEETWDWHGRF